MPTLNLNQNLNEQQRSSITGLLGSGRALNETDARNLAYATGQGNWQQFVGQSTSNYSIGNLAQFAAPATSNTNPANGSNSTLPNLGGSTMGSYFQNSVNSGLSQFEQSILNYTSQQQQANETARTQSQGQYDQAFAGLNSALNPAESGQSMMTRLMGEYGIKEKQDQLVEFQKQLANLQNQATNANNAIGAQPINTAIIRGQQFLKNQEFASKATLIQAQGAIVEGQLNVAKDLVSSFYDAATQDRQNQISRYQTLLGLADNKLVKLDAADKDSLNMMISTLERAETRQTANKDKISALMLDPVASVAFKNTPGLSLDMDYNEIVQKLLPEMAKERLRQFGILHPGAKGSGSSTPGANAGFIKGDDAGNMQRAATYLNTLKANGQFNDSTYASTIYNLIGASNGWADEDYGKISSDINTMLGKTGGNTAPPSSPTNAPVVNTTIAKRGNRNETPLEYFGTAWGKLLYDTGQMVTKKPYDWLNSLTKPRK